MSETRLIALILGVLLVIAVVAYNLWQIRRVRQVDEHAAVPGSAPLQDSRFEPAIGDLNRLESTDIAASSATQVGRDLSVGPESVPTLTADSQSSCVTSGAIAPEVDTVALVFLDADLAPHRLEPLFASLEPLRKAAQVEGLVGGMWKYPTTPVREIRIGMQLVDRRGPVDENDFAHFQQAVMRFADSVSGAVQFEEGPEVLARAAELDRQCAETDIEVAVNIVADDGGGVPTQAVIKSAKALNLTEAGERFLALSTEGRTVYELRLDRVGVPSGTARVSLAIDVPQVGHADVTWAEMVATARAVAAHVNGRLVDDSGRPLNEAGLQTLARSIAANQDRMQAMGVRPGSALAARLFS